MLNLSKDNRTRILGQERYQTLRSLADRPHYRILNRIIAVTSLIALLILFLPWTQNISGSGAVTTLRPEQRPQTIHTAIAGRIEKWYVGEGDFVKKGDTIVYISEVKDEYFDPNLVDNTREQVEAKKMTLESYGGKVTSLEAQIQALQQERTLKERMAQNRIRQAVLKIRSDSIDVEAARTQLRIANTQFNRSVQLQKEGLKPMTDVEEKRLKQQEADAKLINAQNRLLSAQNELINARTEVSRIAAEYDEKISKTKSDRFTALSSRFDTEAQVNKLENQYTNYRIRSGLYHITAPQDGYVNRALQSGLGETIKEGTPIVSIMPANFDVAVETYVQPIDLPLIRRGNKVRVWFDGWPTIVFSGWPGMSYGTFGGRIVAIENFISPNGKYRILIAPDPDEAPWPKQISIGAGAQTLALLETVPVWFEIWRTLNGFPPNYYTQPKNQDAK